MSFRTNLTFSFEKCREYLQSSVLKVKPGRGATGFAPRSDGTLGVAKGRGLLVQYHVVAGLPPLKSRRVLKIRFDK